MLASISWEFVLPPLGVKPKDYRKNKSHQPGKHKPKQQAKDR